MKIVRVHIWISGSVQGVFFRESTKKQASALRVVGWVKNLPDGRVEAVFEGPEDKVAQLLAWCQTGPAGARVSSVEIKHEQPTGQLESFKILYE